MFGEIDGLDRFHVIDAGGNQLVDQAEPVIHRKRFVAAGIAVAQDNPPRTEVGALELAHEPADHQGLAVALDFGPDRLPGGKLRFGGGQERPCPVQREDQQARQETMTHVHDGLTLSFAVQPGRREGPACRRTRLSSLASAGEHPGRRPGAVGHLGVGVLADFLKLRNRGRSSEAFQQRDEFEPDLPVRVVEVPKKLVQVIGRQLQAVLPGRLAQAAVGQREHDTVDEGRLTEPHQRKAEGELHAGVLLAKEVPDQPVHERGVVQPAESPAGILRGGAPSRLESSW